ncbi:unnamed protein product [Arctogadus glacialis]
MRGHLERQIWYKRNRTVCGHGPQKIEEAAFTSTFRQMRKIQGPSPSSHVTWTLVHALGTETEYSLRGPRRPRPDEHVGGTMTRWVTC